MGEQALMVLGVTASYVQWCFNVAHLHCNHTFLHKEDKPAVWLTHTHMHRGMHAHTHTHTHTHTQKSTSLSLTRTISLPLCLTHSLSHTHHLSPPLFHTHTFSHFTYPYETKLIPPPPPPPPPQFPVCVHAPVLHVWRHKSWHLPLPMQHEKNTLCCPQSLSHNQVTHIPLDRRGERKRLRPLPSAQQRRTLRCAPCCQSTPSGCQACPCCTCSSRACQSLGTPLCCRRGREGHNFFNSHPVKK